MNRRRKGWREKRERQCKKKCTKTKKTNEGERDKLTREERKLLR